LSPLQNPFLINTLLRRLVLFSRIHILSCTQLEMYLDPAIKEELRKCRFLQKFNWGHFQYFFPEEKRGIGLLPKLNEMYLQLAIFCCARLFCYLIWCVGYFCQISNLLFLILMKIWREVYLVHSQQIYKATCTVTVCI
jgi:hypothetical protein